MCVYNNSHWKIRNHIFLWFHKQYSATCQEVYDKGQYKQCQRETKQLYKTEEDKDKCSHLVGILDPGCSCMGPCHILITKQNNLIHQCTKLRQFSSKVINKPIKAKHFKRFEIFFLFHHRNFMNFLKFSKSRKVLSDERRKQ